MDGFGMGYPVGVVGGWVAAGWVGGTGKGRKREEEATKKGPKSEPGGRKGPPKVMKRGSGDPPGTVRKLGPDKWPKKSAAAEDGGVPERYGVPANVVPKRE